LNKHDEKLIAKYSSGVHAKLIRVFAKVHGGIERVENDEYIFADGFQMSTDLKPKSLGERWAEENENIPNGGWVFHKKSEPQN
jgi:hypothetical protein